MCWNSRKIDQTKKFIYLKSFFSRSLVWSEVEVSVFYSLPVFQFIPNFFQIYFQFASNSPCFQFLSHVAAISSEMNSCKKSVSFNFKKYVKFFWKRQLSFGLGINFCLLLRWSHMLVESEWCESIVCYGATNHNYPGTHWRKVYLFVFWSQEKFSDLRTECTCNGDANHGNEWAIGD